MCLCSFLLTLSLSLSPSLSIIPATMLPSGTRCSYINTRIMHGIFPENVLHHQRRQMIPWPLPSVSSGIKCFHGFHSTHPPILSPPPSLPAVKMVKFSKQFEAQLVPEWKEAFVDYWQLKKDIKRMQAPIENTAPRPSLALALLSSLRKLPMFDSIPRKEHETIQALPLFRLDCV